LKFQVVLLANHIPGIEVLKYLLSDPDTNVVAIFTTGEDPDYDSQVESLVTHRDCKFYKGKEIWSSPTIVNILEPLNVDFLISVYWPWLLKDYALNSFKDSINFHPALLPKNRGWFPHVYNLKDGTESGVSLHRIALRADSGEIWASQVVPQEKTDTASDLYLRLQSEIVKLFTITWPRVIKGEITPRVQDESLATYNSKSQIAIFDEIDLDSIIEVRSFINLLRARTFRGSGYAYFIEDGVKVSLSISLSEITQD
jgi:methionyl-tRNA formyltransferase